MEEIVLVILFTIVSAFYDNGKRFEDHTPRWLLRAVVIILVSVYPFDFNLLNIFKNVLLNTALFYFIFDYTLNIQEGRQWNYIGNTSKIDRLWRTFGWGSQLAFKIITLSGAIYYAK